MNNAGLSSKIQESIMQKIGLQRDTVYASDSLI